MSTITLLYIIIVALVSVAIAYFQYFFKVKTPPKNHIVLFALKAFSLFLLGLLLINPKIELEEVTNVKPQLSVIADNSLSTKFFKEEENIQNIINAFKSNKELNNKFQVDFFSFGNEIKKLDTLSFSESHTNIDKAIRAVNNLHKTDNAGIVLVSDGNETIGRDYEFTKSKQAVYPVVIGDTTSYEDVKIAQLNVNRYSYLNNKFPVEAFIYYDGEKTINSTFTLYKSGQKIFTKRIQLSPEKKSTVVTTNLTSDKEGIHYYTAKVATLNNEKNIRNNTKNFSVEVINEQSKVLILTSIFHPDLGALKNAIESNKQRKVGISDIYSFKENLDNYQFVILYQPNVYFAPVFAKRKSNFLIITGTKTDWRFLNSMNLGVSKSAINQLESYRASYNTGYLTFIQKNIGFDNFPPLKDKFGTIRIDDQQSLLFQKLQGITTKEPLLATIEKGDRKLGVLLGEGIWKWRAGSYIKESTFQEFDAFVNNLVQYLASSKKRKRLELHVENLYLANEVIRISALYLDSNFKFDNRASLQIIVKNEDTGVQKVYPFSLINSSYQVEIEGLTSGNYSYKVSVEGQSITKHGKFKVADFQIEEQFTNANQGKLKVLAETSGGSYYNKGKYNQLITDLINDDKYYTIQKSSVKEEDLIHWKWLLFIAIGLLSIEWFMRKYFGKI